MSVAAVLFLIGPLTAQDGEKKKIPLVEIKRVRVGFESNDPGDQHGRFKVGMWTPVYLKIKAGPQGIRPKAPTDPEPYIQVENEDNEGVGTVFRTPFRMEPNDENWVMSYAKPGSLGDIKIKVVVGDQVFPPPFVASNPLELHTHEYISLGGRIPDLQATLQEMSKRGQQQFGGQQQFIDTFPRFAGFETEVGNLPEHWFGYHAVDLLILSTKDKEFLLELSKDNDASRARLRAIAQYVRRGGRLVIPVSPRNADVLHQLLSSTVWQPALPVVPPKEGVIDVRLLGSLQAFAGIGAAPIGGRVAVLEPAKLTPGAWQVLPDPKENPNQDAGKPLIARMPYGLGSITYLALPLDEPPFTDWGSRRAFLTALVNKLAPRVGNIVERHQQGNASDVSTDLQKSLDNFDVRVIPFGYVALFIVLYIIVVGPLDFLLLKYVVKRLEWTWFTFPTVVLAVSVAAYFTAYAIKGNELKINKVDLIDIDLRTNIDAKGQPKGATACGHTFFTILSPQIKNYTIGVEPNPEFWGQNPGKQPASADMVSWLGRYDRDAVGGVQRGGGQSLFRKPYRYDGDGAGLNDVPIPVWTTKSFHAAWEMVNLPPPLHSDLAYHQKRVQDKDVKLTGALKNNLGVDLEDVWLIYLDKAYPLADGLKKNSEAKIHFELGDGKSMTDWLSGGGNRDSERLQTAQGVYNPGPLMRRIQFNDPQGVAASTANHALRALDMTWRLQGALPLGRHDNSVHEAIMVARVKFTTGLADTVSRDSNQPLPTNIWVGELPGPGKARPRLDGVLAQDTFVRILLPVNPKD